MIARGVSTRLRYRTLYRVTLPDGTTDELDDRAEAERRALDGGGYMTVIRRNV